MGSGLNGIVSDGISDYFRNPAYLNMLELRTYYFDFDKKGSSNDLRISLFSPLLNGKMGLSISGDATEIKSRNSRSDSELGLFEEYTIISSSNGKTSNGRYNIHLWWANKLSENLKYGFNYIRKSSEISSNRVSNSSRLTTRTDLFNLSTTRSSSVSSQTIDVENDAIVNTFRAGLIFGSLSGMVIDMVLKAEFSDISFEAISDRERISNYSSTRPSYSYTTQSTGINSGVMNSKGSNSAYGMRINLKKQINESLIKSYFLSVDWINFDFSEYEMEKDSTSAYQNRDSIFSNKYKVILSELNANWDATTSYVIGLGAGREVKLDNALIGIGIRGKISVANWDDISTGSSTGLSEASNNDTTISQSSFVDLASVYKREISTMSISFPIGVELSVSKRVSLRLGVEYRANFSKNEIASSSGSILSKFEARSLRNSKSFGIGYRHSEKFGADLMAVRDLAQISLWRFSIQYGL